MTTAKTNTTDRLQLIEDILEIIIGQNVDNIVFESPKHITFTKPGIQGIEYRYSMAWDGMLNINIGRIGQRGVYNPVNVPTSRWFKVAKLLDERHIAAQKLKHS